MNEFQPKLVLDSRIGDISDKIDVAVESSAAQSTYQSFPSVNSSNSSITWNVNVPSENIAIDRRVLIQSTIAFTVNIGAGTAVDDYAFKWGLTDGFGAFPFNSLFSQVQATINNVSVSTPLEDIMYPLLRTCDQQEVSLNNPTTSCLIDRNFVFIQGVDSDGTNSNPVGSVAQLNYNNYIHGNGMITPEEVIVEQYSGTDTTTVVSDSPISLSADNTFKVVVKIKVTEPLLFLSPFQGAVPTNDNACFLGINNMNIVANIRSNLTGFYRTTTSTTHTVSLGVDGGNAFSSPQILLNLLTLQPEQYIRINTRNVLPIQEYPRFVSSYNGTVALNSTTSFTFPVIQLNQVPDTLLVCIRPAKTDYLHNQYTNQVQYLAINSASISFNNQSGILASATKEELYYLSKQNGSKQTYTEFVGQAQGGYSSGGLTAATQGSVLILKPAYNFNLPSYLSGGSLGQFGLQITLNCTNYINDMTNPEMLVIAVNSGMMVTQQGSSSLYSGLLTKNMVLETKQQKPAIDSSTLRKLTGGSIQDSCNTGLRKVLKKHFGSKGGGMSAGGLSAGSHFGDKVGHLSGAVNKYSGAVNKMSKYM